ncbi:hypothetical protein P153DRAFT_339592 [Dothidotthia symphoricarpi CBS 119687]|uniref:F-box domain-containing protein n=1 Tax=Dothidotthia symphoricarpi CBS 119687 TaxID=1392245 RepID=A0A6A6AE51_9PLEO|nr:uncharacterized protein P153DRAFT_339592 [Dothidotthia symphoricarpi CBS 119687]KAF2130080.1 hypothetical protein P153DRAFT_339592 [Dothidotthia symphoricarpi CBS 119687]
MDPNNTSTTNTEAELESFRQKWKEEVTARSKGAAPRPQTSSTASSSRPHVSKSNAPDAVAYSHTRQRSVEEVDEVTPHVYHDLGEKQHGRRLDETSAQAAAAASAGKEPTSALDHYEKAVEKESQGSLGDSVNLYRKAFRLDSKVHESYKAKHFPPSFFKANPPRPPAPTVSSGSAPLTTPASKPQDPNPSNASATVPNTAHHSLDGLSSSLQTLLTDFSSLSIQGAPPPTEFSPLPPCPISTIPEELLVEILSHLVVQDVSSYVRLAQVCKRLAYLVTTEDRVWKRLAVGPEYGFAAMHYAFACQVDGKPLGDDGQGGYILDLDSELEAEEQPPPPSPAALTTLLVPTPYPTYRALFHRRPRIRYSGCYISTVNYSRPGQSSPTSVSWNSPIHIVTYYRYLRFLRDGTCISLLTTSEPTDVVPYLHVEHMHKNHGALPSAPMKDALLGRWRLTGGGGEEEGEKEGTLVVETAGATPKYLYKMMLSVGSAGRGAKNNKLGWQGYWSYNRLTDDWGEFGLKNDRPFFYSRVKSYGMGWGEGGMKK